MYQQPPNRMAQSVNRGRPGGRPVDGKSPYQPMEVLETKPSLVACPDCGRKFPPRTIRCRPDGRAVCMCPGCGRAHLVPMPTAVKPHSIS